MRLSFNNQILKHINKVKLQIVRTHDTDSL